MTAYARLIIALAVILLALTILGGPGALPVACETDAECAAMYGGDGGPSPR